MRAKLERLDQEFVNNQQEYLDNEKENQIIERDLSQAKEHLQVTGKYLKVLQNDNANLTITLKAKKDRMYHSTSAQKDQVCEKEIEDLEGTRAYLTEKISGTKQELLSLSNKTEVLMKRFSELSTRQIHLREKRYELLATLRQHEETLNRAIQAQSPIPHPPPEKEEVLTGPCIMW